MNLCIACGRDFGSVNAFDAHRVGKYPQTGPADWLDRIRAGLVDVDEDWKPTAHFGRRCLEEEELLARGLVQSSRRGAWSLAGDIRRGEQLRRGRETAKQNRRKR